MREEIHTGDPRRLVLSDARSGARVGWGFWLVLLGLVGIAYAVYMANFLCVEGAHGRALRGLSIGLKCLIAGTGGVISSCTGLGLLLQSGGIVLDAAQQTVIIWRRTLFWKSGETVPFRELERVVISAEHLGKDRDGRDQALYDVSIAARGSRDWLLVNIFDQHYEARKTAERVGSFIGIDVADETASVPEVQHPGELNLSFAQRATTAAKPSPDRRMGDVAPGLVPEHVGPTLPPVPAGSRISLVDTGTRLVLNVPVPTSRRTQLGLRIGAGLISACGLALFLWAAVTSRKDELLDWVGISAPLPMCFGIGGILWFTARKLASSFWEVTVSSRRLEVCPHESEDDEPITIPADALKSLRIVTAAYAPDDDSGNGAPHARGGRFILAVSDNNEIRFGEGLTDAELEWLLAVLTRVLTAGRGA